MRTAAEENEEPEADRVVSRHRGLLGRTALVAGLTLFSRVLGFVREILFGALFGDTSAISDAFFTAWRVPNLFRRLLGEGALSTSLQTALTEADHAGGDAAGRKLFAETLRLTLWVLVGATLMAMTVAWFLPDRAPFFGWAWLGSDPAPVRDLMVRLLPFLLVICLAAVCGGALQVRGHYVAPNLAPALMNVVWIAVLVLAAHRFDVGAGEVGFERQWAMARFVAWGVLVGGVVQLAVHVPPLFRFGLVRANAGEISPTGAHGGGIGALGVFKSAAPLALGAAVYQINVMLDGLMAESLLRDGGPSALYYANRIQEFPLALVAISTTSAVFPSMKALGHTRRFVELRALHDRAQGGVLFLALPAAVGLWVLSESIAASLFLHGNYGADGVARIAAGLRMLALALIPAGASGLAGRAYYACGDLVTPVRIASALLVANTLLNLVLVRGAGMDVDGLALATAITSWTGLALLRRGLVVKLRLPEARSGAGRQLARLGVAAGGSGFAAWGTHSLLTRALGLRGLEAASAGGVLAAAALAGAAAFFLLALLLRVPEAAELRSRLARRAGRRP